MVNNTNISTQKASAIEMRKMITLTDSMKNGGILFVPVPCLNQSDFDNLLVLSLSRLGAIEQAVLNEQGN